MRAAGIALWRDHTGWASMGPAAAIPRIPKLLLVMLQTAAHIVASKPDLVVLVNFGVFNLRLARQLRRMKLCAARSSISFRREPGWTTRRRHAESAPLAFRLRPSNISTISIAASDAASNSSAIR